MDMTKMRRLVQSDSEAQHRYSEFRLIINKAGGVGAAQLLA